MLCSAALTFKFWQNDARSSLSFTTRKYSASYPQTLRQRRVGGMNYDWSRGRTQVFLRHSPKFSGWQGAVAHRNTLGQRHQKEGTHVWWCHSLCTQYTSTNISLKEHARYNNTSRHTGA